MIRIISGTHKGRRIAAPSGLPVRPTTDFAKEGLFNILRNGIDFSSIRFLDLFAGTGNISYEFASRGCTDITCVDENVRCVKFISETFSKLALGTPRIVRSDVAGFLGRTKEKWDFIFCDPPFDDAGTTNLPALIFKEEILKPGGLLVIEHPPRTLFNGEPRPFETRNYGKVNFSFFRPNT